jgi:hypothetical protein
MRLRKDAGEHLRPKVARDKASDLSQPGLQVGEERFNWLDVATANIGVDIVEPIDQREGLTVPKTMPATTSATRDPRVHAAFAQRAAALHPKPRFRNGFVDSFWAQHERRHGSAQVRRAAPAPRP